MTAAKYELEHQWIPLSFPEKNQFNETYGFSGSQGLVNIDAILLKPKGVPSKTVLVFMHPAVTQYGLPVPRALAQQGFHVLCATNRYVRNDCSLIFEKVLLDLGAHVRNAKEKLGYEKVVICGWSGGGSLMVFYQSQAEKPSIADTPAGDPVDVAGAKLVPGDGLIFQAASISRSRILVEAIDPSVKDEFNPDDRNVALDVYSSANPSKPPYSKDFVQQYRAAQYTRVRKITATVQEKLADLKKRNTGEMERCFVTHRTTADLRYVDPNVDPNDRDPTKMYIGNPQTANTGPVGLARYSSLRSWLSQWSIDHSRADAVKSGPNISVPFLAIENSADDGNPQTHIPAVIGSIGSKDKTYKLIKGANHYYAGQPELLQESVDAIRTWLESRKLVGG
jgi:dienelactone hydrolase